VKNVSVQAETFFVLYVLPKNAIFLSPVYSRFLEVPYILCGFYHLNDFVMSQITYLTQEGYDRLKGELEEMKTSGRKEISTAIAEAREKGDLSENAEYDAAKDAQGMLEMKINELEKVLANVRILDETQLDTSKVVLLAYVTIANEKTGKEMTYQLVSESEADLKLKKISASSPIGQGLLGKAVGDTALVETPAGTVSFLIKDISAKPQ
jgi:transcription elongation factor GreA